MLSATKQIRNYHWIVIPHFILRYATLIFCHANLIFCHPNIDLSVIGTVIACETSMGAQVVTCTIARSQK